MTEALDHPMSTAAPRAESTSDSAGDPAMSAGDPVAQPDEAGAGAGNETRAGTGAGGEDDAGGGRAGLLARLEREGDIAADYLEALLDIADLDGDIDMDVEGSRAAVSVVGGDLGHLVGADGEVLDALQELTRLAVQAASGERSRLMLDIAGYRTRKKAELAEVGRKAVEAARTSGSPVALPAMSSFERKVVHDVVAAAGLRSESEGEEPQRHVVVLPA